MTTTNSPTNNTPVSVTLTPPPEKDIKEIKSEVYNKPQGKENIPLIDDKATKAKSPEVIDLESENTGSRDKLVIPSLKKRKLEILREGGLEVTAIDLDSRPSVIHSKSSTIRNGHEEGKSSNFAVPSTTGPIVPKLISVTVTPDISHMLPAQSSSSTGSDEKSSPMRHSIPNSTRTASPSLSQNNVRSPNGVSRVINLGSSNNSNLLQLYANANVSMTKNSNRYGSPNPQPQPAATRTTVPPKVTQSRSMFSNNEKTVYGNPKDVLEASKFGFPPSMPQPHAPRNPR